MIQTKPWVRCACTCYSATVRLVCFPHAGGSAAAYQAWPSLLGPDIEVHVVQYPGRADRFAEPLVDDMTTAVERIADELEELSGFPYAFFGHSMGGAIAYEVASLLQERCVPMPTHMFVSGRQPPMHHRAGSVHTLNDEELAAELLRLSAANEGLLSEPELVSLMFPIIRNDYRLIENYTPCDPVVLMVPITVLLGTEDNELTVQEALDWGRCTEHGVLVRQFPGDHFYLVDQRHAVAALVASIIGSRAEAATSIP